MGSFTYRITTKDIARLTGLGESTVKRHMRRHKIKRDCFPSLVRWLYPRIMLAWDEGADARKAWRELLSERKDASEARKEAQKRTISPQKADRIQHTDSVAQAFPSYD